MGSGQQRNSVPPLLKLSSMAQTIFLSPINSRIQLPAKKHGLSRFADKAVSNVAFLDCQRLTQKTYRDTATKNIDNRHHNLRDTGKRLGPLLLHGVSGPPPNHRFASRDKNILSFIYASEGRAVSPCYHTAAARAPPTATPLSSPSWYASIKPTTQHNTPAHA
jgi:hypothetical protein